ncbi:MAG: phage Gp37/Gp68 family protein [Thermodesulfobacteriota bacterium]|nr:phage Gp37/Gp68 family protein [Thermodesulfobacteriota bacterium]
MASQSKIEWTETTWNPVTGCTPISEGCLNCYALRLAKRLKAMGNKRYRNGFKLTLHPDLIGVPLRWVKPRLVFVNSMSDLFHEDIPLEFIQKIFFTMKQAKQHSFQILTKRSTRLTEIAHLLPWPDNIWMGVTIESGKYAYRADNLRKTPAAVRFLSVEPMIGPVKDLKLSEIDWVIVGGESGPKARKVEEVWVKSVRDQCVSEDVPFFFKQWGGTNKKKAGRELEGKIWNQYPKSYCDMPQQCSL